MEKAIRDSRSTRRAWRTGMSLRTAVPSREFRSAVHFARYVSSGRYGRGPRPLKVVSAQPASDVDDFSNEIETGTFLALHGFAGEFFCIHTTGRDFGFPVSFGVCGLHLHIVKDS